MKTAEDSLRKRPRFFLARSLALSLSLSLSLSLQTPEVLPGPSWPLNSSGEKREST
jgi:hypothetical protein